MTVRSGERVLFVECCNCGHKRGMRPGEASAGLPWVNLLERLRCSRCAQYQANIRLRTVYPSPEAARKVVRMGTVRGRR